MKTLGSCHHTLLKLYRDTPLAGRPAGVVAWVQHQPAMKGGAVGATMIYGIRIPDQGTGASTEETVELIHDVLSRNASTLPGLGVFVGVAEPPSGREVLIGAAITRVEGDGPVTAGDDFHEPKWDTDLERVAGVLGMKDLAAPSWIAFPDED